MSPIKITFEMDSAGLHWTPSEPIMIDALLSFACAAHHGCGNEAPDRDEIPTVIPIPLTRHRFKDGLWCWKASALFPEGELEDIQFFRKRFRQGRIDLTNGSPNLTNATWKDWQVPVTLNLSRYLVGWAYGDAYQVRRELRRSIKYLGKKRSHGHGRVIGVTVEKTDDDFSLVRNGLATRYLPKRDGFRRVRLIPPYWNSCETVNVCEVGDPYEIEP